MPLFKIGVELAKSQLGGKQGKFMNYILNLLAKRELEYKEGESLQSLAINYSYPTWIIKKWLKQTTLKETKEILEKSQKYQGHWIRFNLKKDCFLEVPFEIDGDKKLTKEFPYFFIKEK